MYAQYTLYSLLFFPHRVAKMKAFRNLFLYINITKTFRHNSCLLFSSARGVKNNSHKKTQKLNILTPSFFFSVGKEA
jgi:hypothetical protein